MDEWANSLKELEMLLPPTSGGSVTGVCFITKNVQIVCGENTAEYTRYIFTIYTASHNPGTGSQSHNGRRNRERHVRRQLLSR